MKPTTACAMRWRRDGAGSRCRRMCRRPPIAASGILVNAIAPGPILAPPDMTVEEKAEVAAATPLGRWGGEQEIVKAILALIETDFITGETIRVDGGRHLR